jgi:hypothetical protein
MTPMAGGVTDGEEDRLVFLFRFFKGLIAPREPIDRIIGMLEQIGALFVDQSVGFFLYIFLGTGIYHGN